MVRYAADLPVDVIEAHIASALDVIVQTARSMDGSRFVSEIASIFYDEDRRKCHVRTFFKREPHELQGVWLGVPSWIDGLTAQGLATKGQVMSWKRSLRCAA